MLEVVKKVFYAIWVIIILYLLVLYIRHPEMATPEYFRNFLESYGDEMWLVFIVLTVLRGFFLIPSTPFVIGGALLFPDQLFLVLVVSMVGVMLSATALYYFSDMLGFSKYLEKKHPNDIDLWKSRLSSPKAIFFVAGWSLFPLVPTDLICYIAGIVKMPYRYMFLGVFIGELALVVFYIYFGSSVW